MESNQILKTNREFLALFCKYKKADVRLDVEAMEKEGRPPWFMCWYICEFPDVQSKNKAQAEYNAYVVWTKGQLGGDKYAAIQFSPPAGMYYNQGYRRRR